MKLSEIIASLPDNLHVGGYLDLSGTQIASLPDNLHVDGYLDLSGTQIASLPDNLHVDGYLYLRGTPCAKSRAVSGCGEFKRVIVAWNDSEDGPVIAIGCFRGTRLEARKAICEKYAGNEKEEYLSKIDEAFSKI